MGGQDGGAEGQEGDHDAVQHHPGQQEPAIGEEEKAMPNAFSSALDCAQIVASYLISSKVPLSRPPAPPPLTSPLVDRARITLGSISA